MLFYLPLQPDAALEKLSRASARSFGLVPKSLPPTQRLKLELAWPGRPTILRASGTVMFFPDNFIFEGLLKNFNFSAAVALLILRA